MTRALHACTTCILYRHHDVVKLLLDAEADHTAASADGRLALEYAHAKGHLAVVAALKEAAIRTKAHARWGSVRAHKTAGSLKTLLGVAQGWQENEALKARLNKHGQLTVRLCQASSLPTMDGNGLADPYAIVSHGGEERASQVQPMTLDPVWDEVLAFEDHGTLQIALLAPLRLRVMDRGVSDREIGYVSVSLDPLANERNCVFDEALHMGGRVRFEVGWTELAPRRRARRRKGERTRQSL